MGRMWRARGEIDVTPARCLTVRTWCWPSCAASAAGSSEEALHLEFEAARRQSPVITRAGVSVGRAADADLVLDSPATAEHHARLHQCGERPSASAAAAAQASAPTPPRIHPPHPPPPWAPPPGACRRGRRPPCHRPGQRGWHMGERQAPGSRHVAALAPWRCGALCTAGCRRPGLQGPHGAQEPGGWRPPWKLRPAARACGLAPAGAQRQVRRATLHPPSLCAKCIPSEKTLRCTRAVPTPACHACLTGPSSRGHRIPCPLPRISGLMGCLIAMPRPQRFIVQHSINPPLVCAVRIITNERLCCGLSFMLPHPVTYERSACPVCNVL